MNVKVLLSRVVVNRGRGSSDAARRRERLYRGMGFVELGSTMVGGDRKVRICQDVCVVPHQLVEGVRWYYIG